MKKSKILSFVLALCLIIPCALVFTACKDNDDTWNGKTAKVSSAVNGVISIDSAEEFAGFAKSVNDGKDYAGITIKLTKDLNLKNKEWTPIGYGSNSGDNTLDANSTVFRGVFDGQHHTIENFKITTFIGGSTTEGAAVGVGLFGNIQGATIKNLDIENAIVKGHHYVGGAVGFARGSVVNNIDVEDVKITCTFKGGNEEGDKAGAVIGFSGNTMTANGVVKDCSADDCSVSAARDAGQVIGCLSTDNYGAGVTTTSTQSNNEADDVSVTDNNSNNDNINDNVKNEIVGRVKG